MAEKLLTIRETAYYLGITEKQVIDFSQNGVIPAYKVGGIYLRFKKEQLDLVKDKIKPTAKEDPSEYPLADKVSDFFYYNDFYIFSLLAISILVYLIFTL